jgi:hypothetical protein
MDGISFEIKMPKLFFAKDFKFYAKIADSFAGIVLTFFLYNSEYFSLGGSIVFFYFIVAIIWKIGERFSLFLAIGCLLVFTVSVISKNDALAENLSKYLYYFLIILAVQIIWDEMFGKK